MISASGSPTSSEMENKRRKKRGEEIISCREARGLSCRLPHLPHTLVDHLKGSGLFIFVSLRSTKPNTSIYKIRLRRQIGHRRVYIIQRTIPVKIEPDISSVKPQSWARRRHGTTRHWPGHTHSGTTNVSTEELEANLPTDVLHGNLALFQDMRNAVGIFQGVYGRVEILEGIAVDLDDDASWTGGQGKVWGVDCDGGRQSRHVGWLREGLPRDVSVWPLR